MYKDEFSKTSLHNHFGGKSADRMMNSEVTSFFDLKNAKEKIDKAAKNNFEIIAITNSNIIWVDEYLELLDYIKSKGYKLNLIPGIEFNVLYHKPTDDDNKQYLHLIYLLDPKSDIKSFRHKVEDFIIKNKFNGITFDDLTTLTLEYKCILIPHGMKQSTDGRDSLTNKVILDDLLSVDDFLPFMIEDNTKSQRRFLEMKLKSFLDSSKIEKFSTIASISTADRQDFESIKEPTYIWGENTFDALFYCAVIGKARVFREADISNKIRYIKKIKIKSGNKYINECELQLSHGLNSIIGNSGSGKTLLLNLIKRKLTGKNLHNSSSSTNADYEEMYKDLSVDIIYNDSDSINASINIFEGENLYNQIIASYNQSKQKLLREMEAYPSFDKTKKIINLFNSKFNTYVDLKIGINHQKDEISNNLSIMRDSIVFLSQNNNSTNYISFIVDPMFATINDELDNSYSKVDSDIKNVKSSFEMIKKLISEYNVKDSSEKLLSIENALTTNMINKRNSLKVKQFENNIEMCIHEKVFAIVDEYNQLSGKRSKAVNDARQSAVNAIEKLLSSLKRNIYLEFKLQIPVLHQQELINSIENTNSLVEIANVKTLDKIEYEELTKYFSNSIGTGIGKIRKSDFKDMSVNLFDVKSVGEFANVFVKNGNKPINVFMFDEENFITYDVMIKGIDGIFRDINKLSAGQLSKIYINTFIDTKLKKMENNAIIIYDQPDNNLEKTFILEMLGKKITELKSKYQIIITHEPLLVINSDSNKIIYANNDPIGGKSNIHYKNLNLYNVGDKKGAMNEIAKLIDGSHEAIKKRNKVYGGVEYD